MNFKKCAIIFILPALILLWGFGWFLAYVGSWLETKAKEKHDVCLKILRSEIETK